MRGPRDSTTAHRRRSAGLLLGAWLVLAWPVAATRRAWAAPLPVFEGPWLDYFGTLGLGAAPEAVDIDGDGDLDVFVWLYGEPDLRFYRNTGSAASAAFQPEPAGSLGLTDVGTHGVFVDIDGDGDLDAFVGQGDGSTFFFENTGSAPSPAFDWAVANPFGLSRIVTFEGLARPSFADLDDDGDLDAFIGGDYWGLISFFPNTGNGSSPAFANPSFNPFGLPYSDNTFGAAPAFADLDGDGDLDLLEGFDAAGSFPGTAFARNTGSAASPAFATPVPDPFGLPSAGWLTGPSVADLDDDGDLDVLLGSPSGGVLAFRNTGTTSSPAFPPANPFGLTADMVTFVDIDDDADLDAYTDGQFLANVGSPTSPDFAAPTATPFGAVLPAFADIDGDGDFDVFARSGKSVCFFRNKGTIASPAFASCTKNPFGLSDRDTSIVPALADIDGDGDLDLFFGDAAGHIELFRNTGSTATPAFQPVVLDPFGLAKATADAAVTFVDVDRDGDLDAFVGQDDGRTVFFANTGTSTSPSFAAGVTDPFGLDGNQVGARAVPVFADIDDDGDFDAFVGSGSGTVRFFRNLSAIPLFGDGFESGNTNAWSMTH